MTTEATAATAADDEKTTPDPNEALWNEALAERGTGAEKSTEADGPAEPTATADQDAGEPPAEQNAPAEKDIWADAPDHLRTAYQELEARFDRDHRQISGQVRKIKSLQRQIRDFSEARPTEVGADLEDYPEIADAVGKVAKSIDDRLSQTNSANEAELAEMLREQAERLEAAQPGWETFVDENKAAFQAFLADDSQPAWVAKVSAENGQDIVDATQASRLIQRFKEHLGQSARPQSDPADAGRPDTTRTDDRRRRQLDGSSTPPPRGTGALTTTIPANGDPEQIWEAEARRREQKRA
jgi:hypothetical protein